MQLHQIYALPVIGGRGTIGVPVQRNRVLPGEAPARRGSLFFRAVGLGPQQLHQHVTVLLLVSNTR